MFLKIKSFAKLKRHYIIGLLLLVANLITTLFTYRLASNSTPGWHVVIYPRWFDLVSIILFSSFLSYLCYLLCIKLIEANKMIITIIYFIILTISLLLTTSANPLLKIKSSDFNDAFQKIQLFDTMYDIRLYTLWILHFLFLSYLIFSFILKKNSNMGKAATANMI